MSDALPTQKVAGSEYLSCEWCGEAVSQLGTRTPRRYCKRSHRQRAFEARRLGVPMARDRSADPLVPAATPTATPAPAAPPKRPAPVSPPTAARPTMPTPDMSLPRSQRGSLFPPFRAKQAALFEDQAEDEG